MLGIRVACTHVSAVIALGYVAELKDEMKDRVCSMTLTLIKGNKVRRGKWGVIPR